MGDQQDFEKGKGMFFIFTRACVISTNVSVDMPDAVLLPFVHTKGNGNLTVNRVECIRKNNTIIKNIICQFQTIL